MCESFSSDEFLQKLVIETSQNIWEYAQHVLKNAELLSELGFSDPSELVNVVIAIRAGDRLHPTQGFDYMGPQWRHIEENIRFQTQDARAELVEQILQRVLRTLETDGYGAAIDYSRTSSPFQVIYLSHNQTETEQCVRTLVDLGLGTNELSDNLLEKRGEYLVIGLDENISYYFMDS
jgi:hypothetical protein